MTTATDRASENEVTILARVLANDDGQLSHEMARHILSLGFSDHDKARMHDLAVRNQDDALTPEEKEEMFGFAKAGDLLALLKSKARRALGVKPRESTLS